MKNLFLSNLHKKDTAGSTTDFGLWCRRKFHGPFLKLCHIVTKANIIYDLADHHLSDQEYFEKLSIKRISNDKYATCKGHNNIVVERYPDLQPEEPYIFVCNHTCPEDIETVLNVLDRNAYMVLGSVETLKYDPEMYSAWLNGLLPFDILDPSQRKLILAKMERVLKTNSILIFPEGSHNYSPNNLINPLYDGPANLALRTGRKIIAVTMLRDEENEISFMDVSQPIDISDLVLAYSEDQKALVKQISSRVRDKMATAVYFMMARHFAPVHRGDREDLEEYFRSRIKEDIFAKLKWKHDVFEAEYLTKKTADMREYEEVVLGLSSLCLPLNILRNCSLESRPYIQKEQDLRRKNVPMFLRAYWESLKI